MKRPKSMKATEFRIKLWFCLLLVFRPQIAYSQSLNTPVKWKEQYLLCKTVVSIKRG